jgi:hypothetical protein
LRRDLPDIVDMFAQFTIGLPTNAIRGITMAPRLAGKIAFANIGFDGPRATSSRVRGDYDKADSSRPSPLMSAAGQVTQQRRARLFGPPEA